MPGEEAITHPRNNFDFVRLCAATMVLVSHQMPLTGRVEWTFANFHSLGGVGLIAFFAMSGFLVCQSWQRDPDIVRFASRRFLRIWPGRAVAVAVTALVLGPLMSTSDLPAYWSDPLLEHFFVLLRFDMAGELPGVFLDNPLKESVNDSLWTLPIEVRWYGYLALAGLIGFVRWRWLLLALTIGIAVHYFVVFDVEHAGHRGYKEELGLYFLAGACLQRYQALWSRAIWRSEALVVGAALLLWALGKHHAGLWLFFSFTTIAIATRAWPVVRRAGRFGDFSYGVYIYAFPVQQTIIALTDNRLSFLQGTVASLSATFGIAYLSWHLVEAPCLRLKPASSSRLGSVVDRFGTRPTRARPDDRTPGRR